MSSYTFSQKIITPIPPQKGSFPLDHEGYCKIPMIKYMRCLHTNKNDNNKCREDAKEYLGCRMENNLMSREEWSKLGFHDVDSVEEDKTTKNT
ncbi:cytochrome c oxidase assembly protein COX19 [Diachasmimorpha longicaudata]|uniref:cytochrome c oxidase assembly protein COX19 n=1 Tax=Diachasmimorpha longicaudata TaxID=58733 RepID=UPI0030B8DF92